MFTIFKRLLDSKSNVPIKRGQFERILKISQGLLTSLYQFNRQGIWTSIAEEIRELYDCELVSLFLVDEDDSGYLLLKAQCPSSGAPEAVRLKIASVLRRGITGHAAKEEKIITLDRAGIKSNPYIRNRTPTYLASGLCYSALFLPLKNRKGKLLGVLRLHNKNISDGPKQEAFTDTDKSIAELLAVGIVALLENAFAFDALRALIAEVQSAGNAETAVQCILSCAAKLLNASHAKLGLWSQVKSKLVFAGAWNVTADAIMEKGTEIPASSVMVALWNSIVKRPRQIPRRTVGDEDIWLNFGDRNEVDLRRCFSDAKSSVSLVLRVHEQPVGVIHLESSVEGGFDDLDRQILKVLAQNVAVAVQSISMPWDIPENNTGGTGQEILSIGEAGGFFHSVVDHTPLVMWRKDLSGKLIWVNDRFCTRLRKKRSELIGKTDFDLFSKDLAQRYLDGDRKAQEDGRFEDSEEPFVLPSGELSVIHVFKERILDHLGNVAGTQGVFLDVSGDKYRRLFREAPIGFFELDRNGIIFHANKAGREMLGYPEDEIASKRFSDLSSDPDVTEEIVNKYLMGSERDGEWRQPINLSKRDGSTIPASIASCRVTDSENKPTGLLCAVREISAGAEIEAALREPDSRYLARIRELSVPVFRVGSDLRTNFVNDALLRECGMQQRDMIGRTSFDIFKKRDPELARKYDDDNANVLTSEKVLDKIEFHHRNDGKKLIVRVLKFPVRDSNNKVCGVQGVFWKYEDQEAAIKALTAALEEAKEEYRQIVQEAGEGIFQSTVGGRFIAANPAMVRLLGFETEEALLSSDETGIERFEEDAQRNEYFEQLEAAMPRDPQVIDYQIRKRNRDIVWVSETVQKVVDRQGRERLVGFVIDSTDRHHAAEVREDMLRMLAHQLRSPAWQCYKRSNDLVKQMDPKDTLFSGDSPSTVLRGVATIRGLARKTRGVAWSIDMMSTLAHSDRVELSPKELDAIPPRTLAKMAREAAQDVQLIRRSAANFKKRMGITACVPQIQIEIDDNRESTFRIIGVPGLIEQSLGCIVENAFKYSKPSSTIKIHCLLERESVTLSVENKPVKGLEIDSRTRDECRKKDWRSNAARACDADGNGLGLWLVDRIMIAHQGKLHVYETNTHGWNKFSLEFPLVPPAEIKRIA